jgi:hypothetical protein
MLNIATFQKGYSENLQRNYHTEWNGIKIYPRNFLKDIFYITFQNVWG